MVYWSDNFSLLVYKDGCSILHKDFIQEKYETLQERDVNPDDEWCQDISNDFRAVPYTIEP